MTMKNNSRFSVGCNLGLFLLALAQGAALAFFDSNIVFRGSNESAAFPEREASFSAALEETHSAVQNLDSDISGLAPWSEGGESRQADGSKPDLDQDMFFDKVGLALSDRDFFEGFVFKTMERYDRHYWRFYEEAELSEEQVETLRDAIGLRFVELMEGMVVGVEDLEASEAPPLEFVDSLLVESDERLRDGLGTKLYERFVEYETRLPFRNAFNKVEESLSSVGVTLKPFQSDAYVVAMLEKVKEMSFDQQVLLSFKNARPSFSPKMEGPYYEELSVALSPEFGGQSILYC